MADLGFLDQLGLGGNDPRAVANARQVELMGRANQQGFAFGQQAAPFLGAIAGGVAGAISGENDGRSFKGFLQNAGASAKFLDDQRVAQANGITVDQLRSNERIKREVANRDFGPADSIESRIKAAEFVVQEATKDGNAVAKAKALQALDALRKEKAEFDKLKGQERRADDQNTRQNMIEVDIEGLPSGTVASVTTGEVNGQRVPGVEYVDPQTNTLQFAPIGTYRLADDGDEETLDARIRKMIPKQELTNIRNLVITGIDATRKYSRVMDTVIDLHKRGGVEATIGDSGKVISFVDNAVRNLKGVAQAAFSSAGAAKDAKSEIRNKWVERASNVNDSIWDEINLPAEFRATSAAAQQYRANIMELAYMAARLAEPSNRGLSDNDIKNALVRIGADTSNPQVMLRRFAELSGDAFANVENTLSAYSNAFGEDNVAAAEMVIAGKALPKYRAAVEEMFETYDVTIDSRTGRASFGSIIDADVGPGQGVGDGAAASSPEDVDLEDEAIIDIFLTE